MASRRSAGRAENERPSEEGGKDEGDRRDRERERERLGKTSENGDRGYALLRAILRDLRLKDTFPEGGREGKRLRATPCVFPAIADLIKRLKRQTWKL